MGRHLYLNKKKNIIIFLKHSVDSNVWASDDKFFLTFLRIESNLRNNLKAPLGGSSVHSFYSPINPSHPKECPAC